MNPTTVRIRQQDQILTMGSCFADDIGRTLREHKFKVHSNPFGTVYNPISILRLLDMAVKKTSPPEEGFVLRDGYFYHYDFHSDWNDKSAEALKVRLQEQIEKVHEVLKACQFLVITFGTTWIYERTATKSTVANCHKIPQDQFNKILLTQKQIVKFFESTYSSLKKVNPACQVILTVSPVRHVKDTLELNSVSKSILRLTCHTLCEGFEDVFYFPSYEIMMDDLRDYRFYKPDMIHPTGQAIEYIWQKFGEAFFDVNTLDFISQWKKIQSALSHTPLHPSSEQHQRFLEDLLEKLLTLKSKTDVEEEIENVKLRIRSRIA